jgi:hypothetical protein
MIKRSFIIGTIVCCLLYSNAQETPVHVPHLKKNGNYTQLIVDNKPFLILGGELGNSSASSNDYMQPIWPKLRQMNLNTVFAPVYWELMEPLAGWVIISVAPDEFYVAGTGVVITFASTASNKRAGFLSIDEGKSIEGKWFPGRRMNGDQDHQGRHVRIPVGDYSIQKIKLYTY